MKRIFLVSLICTWSGHADLPAQSVPDWLPRINFRPALPQQAALMTRPAAPESGIWYFHKIEGGAGPLNLDSYGITVVKPPKAGGRELKPEEVLYWLRTHLSDFLDPGLATCQVEGFEDQWKWQSANAAAGALLQVSLKKSDPPGTACLAVSEQNADASWVLSTVHAAHPDFRDWPVQGNRWFGWIPQASPAESETEPGVPGKKGKSPARPSAKAAGHQPYQIVTRGAWRLPPGTDPAKLDASAAQEDALWKGWIQRVQAFITAQGGEWAPASRPDGLTRLDWDPIRNVSFFPPVPWIDPEGSWTSTDPKSRFRLVIHPGFRQCDFIERTSSGLELSRTVPVQSAGDSESWKIERSSVDPQILEFLGFDSKAANQIIGAAPAPSYLTFSRKGALLKARWHGFIVERDAKGGVAAIKAPGATRPKDYDFRMTPVP